ncbi:exopolysaccharide biosynthesis polyprenyl glycosylphosphotransferase [Sphingomonas sp. OK281]|uniref:exopolysaccharide biosynthesis polyprenyl glycosylphosphotransferase n=1 Tax=Sphingomonas sp. OK281 TaxID=1881067 RepID=UPI0008E29D13|nr:exopolysaccharide biosynthesis polyprenyl glycosylphosphotransferase [Sphingomonas sp. OK281]SFO20883.1 exopolysaccharide biosynthesis polyprenyl glycosylphosphotransferase [Sphingomonas sp. OK281]
MILGILTVDIGCIVASYLAAVWLHGMIAATPAWADVNWILILVVLLPVFVLTTLNNQSYAAANLQDPFRSVSRGLQAYALAISAVIFIAFCLKTSDSFPRLVVSIGSGFALASLALGRFLFVRHMHAIIGGNPFSIVLLHDPGQRIPQGNFSVVISSDAYFDPDRHDPVMYDRLAQSLSGADRVIVACAPQRRLSWAQALKGANIQSEIFMPELDALAPLGISAHAQIPTVIIANGPLGLFDRFVKRGFDVALAMGALLFLMPMLILIAIAVKIDSPGPVFFSQIRIGRSNQMFRLMKFRSMRIDGCDGDGARSTARDDDRITRVGKIIRSTSIDELPQLLNVLKGDMSIVGPRPHALGSRAADKLFWEVDQRYWHRHAAKPGLTGLAQVRGYRGATLYEDDLRNRLQADLEYLEHWSIWRDIKIIVLTFRVLLHRNAF